MDRRLKRSLVKRLTLTALFFAFWPVMAFADAPSDGDRVVLEGTVVDGAGQPAKDIAVVLEATREKFSLRHFENRRGETLKLPERTDENGRFRFEWTWDRHYNVFEIAFGLEVTRDGAPGFEIVERRDITSEVSSGASTALRIELDQVDWLQWLRLYIDGRASDDEKKIYRELGRPDKLTVDGTLSSWWYFTLGKVYRLEGGRLEQVVPFDPIEEPAEATSPGEPSKEP